MSSKLLAGWEDCIMSGLIHLFFLVILAWARMIGAGVITDIEYGKAGDVSLRLDASVPEGNGPFPIAILVHGGGWSRGDKQDEISTLFAPLMGAKFTWFSINYRLAPAHRYPAGLEDVETAIRWVKVHAAEYKGDARRIVLIGYSAGGHLTSLAAVRASADTRVQAVVGLAPPTDLVLDTLRRDSLSASLKNLMNREAVNDEVLELLWNISPINHLNKELPPFLLIHGTRDKSVPFTQSLHLQARLKAFGVPCDLIAIENAPHAIMEWEKIEAGYKSKIVAWLQRTL
jgi:acetyl esterase/lipase